uniref:Golgin subfamily A member 6-like protein 22 n=1 Tax=Steinernema glaseri TaxID=37863 RepID=A0A1I7YJD6_9BILA
MYFNNTNPWVNKTTQNTYSQDYYSSGGYGTSTTNPATGAYNATSEAYNATTGTYNATTGTYSGPMNGYSASVNAATGTGAGTGTGPNPNTQNVPSVKTKMLEEENARLRQHLRYANADLEESRRAYDDLSREFGALRFAHSNAVNEVRRLQEVLRNIHRPKRGGYGPSKWKTEREQWQLRVKRSEEEKKTAAQKLEKMESDLKEAMEKLKKAQEDLERKRNGDTSNCEQHEALEKCVRAMENDIEVKITDIKKAKLTPAIMEEMSHTQRLIKSEPVDYDFVDPKVEPMTPKCKPVLPKIEPVTPALPAALPHDGEAGPGGFQEESGGPEDSNC